MRLLLAARPGRGNVPMLGAPSQTTGVVRGASLLPDGSAVVNGAGRAMGPALDPAVRTELAAVYDQVPATGCASSGDCCALTDAEYDGTFATMFPVYRVEYLNLVDHVAAAFDAPRRRALLGFVEERPRRCPFLSADHRCTAYPARPLICRTYGVMSAEAIAGAAARHDGRVPREWIDGFVRRESSMACPRVRVLEPEKLERHAANLIGFSYERELLRLSHLVGLAGGERRRIFSRVTGGAAWPLSWTWGGFNAIRHAPLAWLRRDFDAYWRRAWLADAS